MLNLNSKDIDNIHSAANKSLFFVYLLKSNICDFFVSCFDKKDLFKLSRVSKAFFEPVNQDKTKPIWRHIDMFEQVLDKAVDATFLREGFKKAEIARATDAYIQILENDRRFLRDDNFNAMLESKKAQSKRLKS